MATHEWEVIGQAKLSSSKKAVVLKVDITGIHKYLVINKARLDNLLNNKADYAQIAVGKPQ